MWHYHYVAELNYIEEHLAKGDAITALHCDADQQCCEANPERKLAHCLRCMGIWQHGQSLLSAKVETSPLILDEFKASVPGFAQKRFSSVADITSIEYDGFDIGWAVYSSLVDRTMDVSPDLKKNRDLIRKLFLDSYRIYKSAVAHLERVKYDRVYIFNGRYAGARPWIRACEKMGIPFYTHEKIASPNRAIRWESSLPHNPEPYSGRISEFWETVKDTDSVLHEAKEFFEERPAGKMTGWVSFVDAQTRQSLPENWDETKKNIVIFTSTEWEFVAVLDMIKDSVFKCQEDAYALLIQESLKIDPNIHFYIRVHPNSETDKQRWWEWKVYQELKNCTIIPPKSPISSYAMLQACSASLTYLSTIGIEATYWRKPSIVLGRSIYCGLDAVYEPKSSDEAVAMICSDLKPKPQINALKYGAFMRCGGDPLPFSEPVNYYTLKFKDQILEARQEVREWLGECEKRNEVTGWQKWSQDRKDKKRFDQIIKECNESLAAQS